MGGDPRYFLAAERTFLAWIRTGLALMGLGFVVARFGLFLREIQAMQSGGPAKGFGLSLWFGTAFIVLGVAINIASIFNHVRLVRRLRDPDSTFDRPSSLGISMAVLLAAVGIGMAVYLVSVR